MCSEWDDHYETTNTTTYNYDDPCNGMNTCMNVILLFELLVFMQVGRDGRLPRCRG